MFWWKKLFVVAAIVVSTCSAQLIDSILEDVWENSHYSRTIDLLKSYVKETNLIEAKNINTQAQSVYYFTVNDGFDIIPELSVVLVTLLNPSHVEVEYEEVVAGKLFKITLPVPISPNSSFEIKVNYVYIGTLLPMPASLKMADTQLLLLKLNKFAYSPYRTTDYSLTFTGVAKGQEMELLKTGNFSASDNVPDVRPRVEDKTLKYGPVFDYLEPFTLQPMGLLYEHNRPLGFVQNLNRSVWIPASNVKQLPFEEYYELTNTGAELSTGFSRVDWLVGRFAGTRNHWALSHIEIPTIGDSFDDYYYTDKVGMVDSHDRVKDHLLLQPRFPLFGGWNYNFTLGWNGKLANHVHKVSGTDDQYIAKVPLLNAVRDVTYNNTYLVFYLPENAEFVNVSSPIDFESLTVDNELSYLDVSNGHVRVTLHYKNLFDDVHRLDVLFMYKYTQSSYLLKVLKISGFVFVGLISYYLLGLVDLSIEDKKKD